MHTHTHTYPHATVHWGGTALAKNFGGRSWWNNLGARLQTNRPRSLSHITHHGVVQRANHRCHPHLRLSSISHHCQCFSVLVEKTAILISVWYMSNSEMIQGGGVCYAQGMAALSRLSTFGFERSWVLLRFLLYL